MIASALPVRILHVFDHSLPEQSGYAFRSAAIIREQRHAGWETIQLTGPKQQIAAQPRECINGIDYYRTLGRGSVLGRVPVLNQLDAVRRIRARLREIVALAKPDVVHAHSPCLNGLAALGLGTPLVYELRSSWEDAAVSSGTTTEGSLRHRASRALETHVLRRADAVTTICEGLREEILRRGIDSRRVTVIPNGVDPDALAARHASGTGVRARFGLQDKYVLGFIGSFFAWEGLVLLVEALPKILGSRADVRVLLAGAGPDAPRVRAAVARLGLEPYVVFAGSVPHDEVGATYDALDMVIYPRTPMRLTEMVTPLKPLEAMALGKVIVASDVGGHRELISDGLTGVLFRAGDANALAAAVLAVAGDSSLRKALAASGPRFVREHRAWSSVVRRYEPVYRRVMRRDEPAAAEPERP